MNSSTATPKTRVVRGKGKRKLVDLNAEPSKQKKIWTKEEVDNMAEFVVRVNGKTTPRANFIKQMMTSNNWTHLTNTQVGNRWDILHKLYIETVRWKNETGQGVLAEEGEQSFHATLVRRCPQFDVLDSILGTKAAVNAPAIYESDPPEFATADENIGTNNLEEYELEYVDDDDGTNSFPPANEAINITSATNNFRKSLTKATESRKIPSKSGQDRIADLYEKKAVIEEQKLDIQREKVRLKANELELRKHMDKDQMELSRYEIQRKADLDQEEQRHRHTLEVATLTKDPQLIQLLIKGCLAPKMAVPPPPIFPE